MTRSGWRALVLLAATSAAAIVVLQCHSYGEATNAPVDAATDVTTTPPTEAGASGCNHALPPANANKDDAPGTTVPPFWMSLDTLNFPLVGDAGVHYGFDLDNTCTCFPDDHDGEAPCATPAVPRTTCDFDGGIDDGLAATAVASFGQYINGNQGGFANGVIAGGGPTELVYVTGYNGKANDPQVGIAIVRAGGLLSNLDCGNKTRADAGSTPVTYADGGATGQTYYPPAHDGCDRYSAVPGPVIGTYPTRGPLVNVPGYVVDGQLVVQLPQIDLPLGISRVTLLDPYFVAKITPQGASFRLDNGLAAGRVHFEELVAFLGNIPVVGQSLCKSSFWSVVQPTLCAGRDTMASPNDEFQNKVCDSVSMGVGFTARPAQVDDVEFTQDIVDQCAGVTVDCQ